MDFYHHVDRILDDMIEDVRFIKLATPFQKRKK